MRVQKMRSFSLLPRVEKQISPLYSLSLYICVCVCARAMSSFKRLWVVVRFSSLPLSLSLRKCRYLDRIEFFVLEKRSSSSLVVPLKEGGVL